MSENPTDGHDVTAVHVDMVIHTDRYLAVWPGSPDSGISVYRDPADWAAYNDPIDHLPVEPGTPRTDAEMAARVTAWCRVNPDKLTAGPLFLIPSARNKTLHLAATAGGFELTITDHQPRRGTEPVPYTARLTAAEWDMVRMAVIASGIVGRDRPRHIFLHLNLASGDSVRSRREESLIVYGRQGAMAVELTGEQWERFAAAVTATPAEDRPRRCLWISGVTLHGQYVPSLVTEGEPGHVPVSDTVAVAEPWQWGERREDAERAADLVNQAAFGLTPQQAQTIVASRPDAAPTR